MMKLHLFITKKKGKAYKIRFTFSCYFRLNIQNNVCSSKILGLVILKMNKNTKITTWS